MDPLAFDISALLLAGHIGFSGSGFFKVGKVQYLLHKLYAVSEPAVLRMVDFLLSRKLMTDTPIGRGALLAIARLSWLLPHGIVVTTEAAERVVDFIHETEGPKGGRLAVGPCVCQAALQRWQEPVCKDIVLLYGSDIYTKLDMGYRFISAEEAKQMLREFHRAGLVHELDFCMQSGKWTFVICNCEKEICALTRVYLLTGEFLYPGPEIVLHNPQKCKELEKCGKCLDRCLFDANIPRDGRVMVEAQKCLGCGLCVSTCSGKAREMVPRKDYAHEHQIPSGLLLGRSYGVEN